MSNRNFDSRVIIQRLQNQNYARNLYINNVNSGRLINNPQNTDGNSSRQNTYTSGVQTEYFRGLLDGAKTVSLGGTFGISPFPLPTGPSATVPDSPTSVSAVGGNTQATVSFTAPVNDGGFAITGYTVTSDPDGITASGSSSSIIVTGLTNGTSYTFTVIATNSIGDSLPSDPSSAVIPSTIPSAPTITGITGGDQELSVAFTAGATGSSAITNYKYSTDNGTTFRAFSPVDTISPLVITTLSTDGTTLLTNNTTYQIKILAVNVNGDGAASTAVSGTPSAIPSAPTITGITGGDQELSVAFTAGATGGSVITNYKYSTNNGTTFIAFNPVNTTSPLVITTLSTDGTTLLTNGTTYQIKILAVNANGDGAASTRVNGTPSTTPSAPTITSILPNSQQLSVAFTAGATGGLAITNYKYSTDNGTTFRAFSPADTTSPAVITTLSTDGTTLLTNNTTYQITILAVNANGDGAQSNVVNGTPLPAINVIIVGNNRVTTLSSSLQSARTDLKGAPLSITTQELNGYTGANLTSFEVVIFYTDGNLNLNAPLGANLDAFVASGRHLIMASFCWGNVSAVTGFTYNSYSTYQFKGTYSSVDATTAVYTVIHPITTGIDTSTGLGSPNIPNPINLTTVPGSQVIATFGAAGGNTSFIAVGQNGSSRLVGFNAYLAQFYSGNVRNTIKYVCNSIYWCKGLI